MTLGGFILLFLTGLAMAAANLLMRYGILQVGAQTTTYFWFLRLLQQPAVLGGILLSGIAALLWWRILAAQPLSTCYPIFASLTYLLITCGASYLFQETVSVQKMIGMGAIILGIAAVARG